MAWPGVLFRSAFGVPSPDRDGVARVKGWARSAFRAPPDTAFAVNEIACHEAGCPGVATVLLVIAPGAAIRRVRIAKALSDVTEHDVDHALKV